MKIVISQANFWWWGSSAPHKWYSWQKWRSLWTRSMASSATYTHVRRIHRRDKRSTHITTGPSFTLQTMLTQRLCLVPNAQLFFIQTISEHQVNADWAWKKLFFNICSRHLDRAQKTRRFIELTDKCCVKTNGKQMMMKKVKGRRSRIQRQRNPWKHTTSTTTNMPYLATDNRWPNVPKPCDDEQ